MIVDKILDCLFYLPLLLLETLPDLDLAFPDDLMNIASGIDNFLCNIAYVVPFSRIQGIFIISIAIKSFQILWALVIRIKSFIPTMGA